MDYDDHEIMDQIGIILIITIIVLLSIVFSCIINDRFKKYMPLFEPDANLKPSSLVDLDNIDYFINNKINQQWKSFEVEITKLNRVLAEVRKCKETGPVLHNKTFANKTYKHLQNIFQSSYNILYIYDYNMKQNFTKLNLTTISNIENNLKTIKSNIIKSYAIYVKNNKSFFDFDINTLFSKEDLKKFNLLNKKSKKLKLLYNG